MNDAQRINRIRRQIEAGTYETSGRLYIAVARLAEVLEARVPAIDPAIVQVVHDIAGGPSGECVPADVFRNAEGHPECRLCGLRAYAATAEEAVMDVRLPALVSAPEVHRRGG